tara:strand:+ start:1236 stop:1541 length:306 start_codon:yes stop_codon:yes gene_type:complete
MKFLKQNISTSSYYTINGLTLNSAVYDRAKVDVSVINIMKEEMGFTKHSSIYDIAMDSFCGLGYSDIDHEKFLKEVEVLFERDLEYKEVIDYAQALNDYQE